MILQNLNWQIYQPFDLTLVGLHAISLSLNFQTKHHERVHTVLAFSRIPIEFNWTKTTAKCIALYLALIPLYQFNSHTFIYT